MKNRLILLLISCFILIPTVKADGFYSWLENNDSVVTADNKNYYISTYGLTGLSEGTVFLNMTMDNKVSVNDKDLSLSTTQLGLTYVDFYKANHSDYYLDMIRLIANNIVNKRILTGTYIYDNTKTLTFTCPQMKMNGEVWSCDNDYQEVYPSDNLLSVRFLLDAYELTNDINYKNTALEVLDTWVYIQEQYKSVHNGLVSGGIPFLLYREHANESFRLTWTVPNDSAYAVYEASTKAYELTNDEKYNQFKNNFFNYLINRLSQDNALFTFEKNGKTYKLPYEFTLVNEQLEVSGANQSNQNGSYSTTNDLTSDQLFYTLLGLMRYNKDLDICHELFDSLSAIVLPNGSFWGEYDINGNKGSHDVYIEIVNSGFYLELLKLYNASEEEIEKVVRYLMSVQLIGNDNRVDGSWRWDDADLAVDSVNETLATAVILKALRPYVRNDRTTIFDPVSNGNNEEPTITESAEVKGEEKINNPQTGDSIYQYIIILIVSVSSIITLKKNLYN